MFITFEGTEGSGKTTQAHLLKEFLESRGFAASYTREPGWGALGKLIRAVILDERDLALDPTAELCLFCADRAQHVKDFIKPRLKAGEVVICDRYADSTLVYQGVARKLDSDLVKRLAKASTLGVVPDLTILLDLEVRYGLQRLGARGERTKMDEEPVEFHEQIRDGYLSIARREPTRIIKLDASKSIEEIQEEIRKLVIKRMA
ncbi:MAG: dTMP kinase [Deltaproteobacteria bacterium]